MSQAGHVEWDLILGVEADLHTQRPDPEDRLRGAPNVAAQGPPGACSDYGVISVVDDRHAGYNKEAFRTAVAELTC